MTPDEKMVPYARLVVLADLVRREKAARLRHTTSRRADDRAIAEHAARRLDAAVDVILGPPDVILNGEGGAA